MNRLMKILVICSGWFFYLYGLAYTIQWGFVVGPVTAVQEYTIRWIAFAVWAITCPKQLRKYFGDLR